MTQFLAGLSLAILSPGIEISPQYTFEVVPDISELSPARLNSSGSICASSTYTSSSRGGRTISESGTHSWMRVNGSTVFFNQEPVVNLLDINDNNIAVGTLKMMPFSPKLCVTDGRKVTPVDVSLTPFHRAFVNASGEIAFQVQGQGGNLDSSYRWRDGKLRKLPFASMGAITSTVWAISNSGDIAGTIHFPTGSYLRIQAAVWTRENDIIALESPQKCEYSTASGLVSKDLVWGNVYINRGWYPAIWKEGKLEIVPIEKGTQCTEVVCRNDGTPIVTIKTGSKQQAMQRVNGKWVALTSLVKGLPKDVAFGRVLQRSSNEKVLVFGKILTDSRYFVLTPLTKS